MGKLTQGESKGDSVLFAVRKLDDVFLHMILLLQSDSTPHFKSFKQFSLKHKKNSFTKN